MFAVTWEHYRFSLLKVKMWWQCGLRSLLVESNNICKIFESNNIWNILKAIIWALKIWKCTQLQCNSINTTQFKIDKHKNSEARSSIFLLIYLFICLYMNLNMDTLFTVLKGEKDTSLMLTPLSIPQTAFIWVLRLLHNEAVTVLYYHECLSHIFKIG